MLSDNTFQTINNLLIYIKLNNNFNKGAYPSNVSIRPTTGIKPLYTTIATVTMNLIVSATYSGAYPFTFQQLIKHKNSL